ncbi:hypothetical protein [Paractinoplanes durhamensis]|uniref:hypothetical protein n=1 Tax=Paractinoplanes durhamensis TaxID=113563 RepID=UPI00362EE418
MTGAAAPYSRARFGWVFAAIWLFYLGDTLGQLVKQPDLVWRTVGIVALVAFAASYLYMVRLAATLRQSLALPRAT